MKRFIREIAFDITEPGLCIRIMPVIAGIFLGLASLWHGKLGLNDTLTLALLELLIPFLGGYGAVMLMQGLLDTDGCELLFSYPRSNRYWGVYRQVRFFCLFAPLAALTAWLAAQIMEVSAAGLVFLTLVQSFAVMAVGFFGVALTRRVSGGLILLIAFVGIQITLGREFSIFNWIYVLSGRYPATYQILPIGVCGFLIGIFGWGVGQIWIRPAK